MRELERDTNRTAASLPALAVVGAGRVGGAVARAAAKAGLDAALAGRDDALAAARGSEAVLLCVPDAAIAEAAGALASAIPPVRFVGHTSGVHGLAALSPALAAGAATFALHPLQTIPGPDTELGGSPCAVAGSTPEALELAVGLASALGMRPFEVPDEARVAYHAAASMASNFLVALEESAAELLARAGIESGRELLAPLVLRTAANWAELGPAALTGPIARGDEATVELHLEALDRVHPALTPAYLALADRARALASLEVAR